MTKDYSGETMGKKRRGERESEREGQGEKKCVKRDIAQKQWEREEKSRSINTGQDRLR